MRKVKAPITLQTGPMAPSYPFYVDHMLQLFDSRASRADAVAAFVREGLMRGEVSVVVMSRPHWDRTASRLAVYGIDVDDAIDTGRLTVMDAHDTLKKLSRGGVPDRNRFDATVGTLMRRQLGPEHD